MKRGTSMFVTTAGRTTDNLLEEAHRIANELSVSFIPRRKRSIEKLQSEYGEDFLVVGNQRLELYHLRSKEPFFFHPNVAMIRLKRLMNGEEDPYLTAAQISRGTTVLDCTLGLGAEAIVASFGVGSQGKIIAIEESPLVGFVVKIGLSTYNSGHSLINEAMQRIHVQIGNHYDQLKKLPDNQFDVVYFDPMFEKSIDESTGIQPLSPFASLSRLTETTMKEAKRVARNRVVLKAHYQSSLFTELGFHQVKRKTALFHYGYIEL